MRAILQDWHFRHITLPLNDADVNHETTDSLDAAERNPLFGESKEDVNMFGLLLKDQEHIQHKR
jgi:hypothetical protein